jgi:hypothetical protein
LYIYVVKIVSGHVTFPDPHPIYTLKHLGLVVETTASYNFTDAACSHWAVPTLCIRLTPEATTANFEKVKAKRKKEKKKSKAHKTDLISISAPSLRLAETCLAACCGSYEGRDDRCHGSRVSVETKINMIFGQL